MVRRRRALVFDSGLGGLTVFARIAEARPDLELVYAADDAFFPYGALGEAALVERVGAVMDDLIARTAPDVVVIACNTASTLVLPPLRAAYPQLPFVGTVPAIKPAAEASKSRMISVLATPGTVARDYTRALVRDFAAGCEVTLVGAPNLAGLAERRLRGEPVADADVAREIDGVLRRAGGAAHRPGRARLHAFSSSRSVISRAWRRGRSPSSIRRRRSPAASTRWWASAGRRAKPAGRSRLSSPADGRPPRRCEKPCAALA